MSDDKLHNRGFYFKDLVEILEIHIDNYKEDRESYWSEESNKSPLADVLFAQAERFANALLNNTEHLVYDERLDDDLQALNKELAEIHKLEATLNKKFKEIWESKDSLENKNKRTLELLRQKVPDVKEHNSPLRLVWEKLCVEMGQEAIEKIKPATNKILQLYSLVLRSSPSKPTREFLSRLSRCYIWEFDPECVILCRAVLDTAFRDAVSDKVCEKHFGKKPGPYYSFSLNERIHAAIKEGIIDEDTKKLAITVKQRGDKAVHYKPFHNLNIYRF